MSSLRAPHDDRPAFHVELLVSAHLCQYQVIPVPCVHLRVIASAGSIPRRSSELMRWPVVSSQVQVQSHSSLCQQETSACSVSSSSSSLLHTLRHSSSTPGATTAPRLRTAPMLFLQLATIILDWPLRSLQADGRKTGSQGTTVTWCSQSHAFFRLVSPSGKVSACLGGLQSMSAIAWSDRTARNHPAHIVKRKKKEFRAVRFEPAVRTHVLVAAQVLFRPCDRAELGIRMKRATACTMP